MPYKIVKPVIDCNVRNLCTRKYPNHPKGCPNYGKKAGCPPHCRSIEEIIDLDSDIFVVWNIFDFAAHCQWMKVKHPQWSTRQVECCLYWQQGARKELGLEIIKFTKLTYKNGNPTRIVLLVPEARGVNVTETMKSIGEVLEWPPKTKTYQVALIGTKI